MANKSILVDLGVYLADNNVRRNIADFRVNSGSIDSAVAQVDTNVLPAGSYSFTGVPNNVLTVVRTTKPLVANVNQGSTSFAMTVNSLLVLTDEIAGITFQNDGTDPAQLLVIQC